MNLQSIKTEQDYNQALQRLEDIFDAKPDTKDGDELEALANLIEEYENENFPIEAPND
ncbi:hypothetical protein NG800_004955 [Epilithonimonas ginsengisoli]|uniref:Transcriptional regulator n=1 Tax=Epilithonimonas ginsengisoli TaxID=1245592 RepID=A0ABU4JEZ6_9FLAO|nr:MULTISPECIES: transcriptional regulator [Chryseobacterium group]MBV6879612.1 hypothetical protein [Epilithonimonas sp. FP105]MDW8548249.1 hypothetical protein [Epilithonimonas ginsengisoli]